MAKLIITSTILFALIYFGVLSGGPPLVTRLYDFVATYFQNVALFG